MTLSQIHPRNFQRNAALLTVPNGNSQCHVGTSRQIHSNRFPQNFARASCPLEPSFQQVRTPITPSSQCIQETSQPLEPYQYDGTVGPPIGSSNAQYAHKRHNRAMVSPLPMLIHPQFGAQATEYDPRQKMNYIGDIHPEGYQYNVMPHGALPPEGPKYRSIFELEGTGSARSSSHLLPPNLAFGNGRPKSVPSYFGLEAGQSQKYGATHVASPSSPPNASFAPHPAAQHSRQIQHVQGQAPPSQPFLSFADIRRTSAANCPSYQNEVKRPGSHPVMTTAGSPSLALKDQNQLCRPASEGAYGLGRAARAAVREASRTASENSRQTAPDCMAGECFPSVPRTGLDHTSQTRSDVATVASSRPASAFLKGNLAAGASHCWGHGHADACQLSNTLERSQDVTALHGIIASAGFNFGDRCAPGETRKKGIKRRHTISVIPSQSSQIKRGEHPISDRSGDADPLKAEKRRIQHTKIVNQDQCHTQDSQTKQAPPFGWALKEDQTNTQADPPQKLQRLSQADNSKDLPTQLCYTANPFGNYSGLPTPQVSSSKDLRFQDATIPQGEGGIDSLQRNRQVPQLYTAARSSQPLQSAKIPGSSQMGSPGPSTSTDAVPMHPSKASFLNLFESFYDTLQDARVLKISLDENIRKSTALLQTLQASSVTMQALVHRGLNE